MDDIDRLAAPVAAVALGQARHVERVLAGAQLGPPPAQASVIAGAIRLLTVVGDDPSHRDGWLFQVISWIAAHKARPGGLIRAPHMLHAHKGFDGLELELDANGRQVAAAVIFEDKATTRARDTIRDEVWSDFRELEAGDRDHVLASEVSALLRMHPAIDADMAVANVIWKAVRSYRVSVTITATHRPEARRRVLFRGYEDVAPGGVHRRRGHVVEIPELRNWMQQLAQASIRSIEAMRAANV